MGIVIGIDPGLTGALATVRGRDLLRVDDMPVETSGRGNVKRRVSAAALADLLRTIRSSDDVLVVIEFVAAMPKQGVSSVFSLGDTAGCIRGVVQSLRMRCEFVTPSAWKQQLKLTGDKDLSRTLASQRWPDRAQWWPAKCHHNRAEAALLAAYGWETYE